MFSLSLDGAVVAYLLRDSVGVDSIPEVVRCLSDLQNLLTPTHRTTDVAPD